MNRTIRWLTGPAFELVSMANDTAAVLRRELRYRDVPAVAPSAGLIGEAILDAGFSMMVNVLVGVPESQRVRHGHRELLALRDFIDRKGFLESPDAYHRRPPVLRKPEIRERRAYGLWGSVAYEELVFESGYAPHPGEPGREAWLAQDDNASAVAYVMRHAEEDRPWILCTHGFGMGQPGMNIAGLSARWMHEELGLNVLLPVLPLHGPRSATLFSGGGLLQPDFSNMLHLFAQSVWDLRRLVGWVRTQSDRPVGLYGISLGAYVTSLASAFIDDLGCVVAGIPAVDFTSLARDNEPPAYQAFGEDLQTDWGLVQQVMHPVSPLSFEPRASVERRYIYAGVADRVARPDQARSLWRHWGRPEIAWMSSGHVLASMKEELKPFLRSIAARDLFEGRPTAFTSDDGVADRGADRTDRQRLPSAWADAPRAPSSAGI